MMKNDHAIPLIIGHSSEMMGIKKTITKLSQSTEPVLIRGEPGSGKELAARTIHYQSNRKENRFVKIDSAALSEEMATFPGMDSAAEYPETVLNTALYQLERADGGTLFFEEIGKIPPSLQTELFLIFEESAIADPESQTKRPVDIRIVASTSIDLSRLVKTGSFRKDLYFRLNVFSINMPALRDRKKDIPLLVDYFTNRFCMENERSHFNFSPHAQNIFANYSWPGNVAELEDKINRALLENDENWMIDPILPKNRKSKLINLADCGDYIDSLAELTDVKNYIRDMQNISLKHVTAEFIDRVEKKLIRIGLG